MPVHQNPERKLWYGALLTTAFLTLIILVATFTYGLDPVMAFASLLSLIALVGIWKQSAAGRAFLGILLLLECFYLVTAGLAFFGAAALAGQGFRAVDRLTSILLVAIGLTVLPLALFTTFLNRVRSGRSTLS
jgi:hypothetical protein